MKCSDCETVCDDCGTALTLKNAPYSRIVQIVLAPGWWVVYKNSEGKGYFRDRLIGWGLTVDGDIHALDTDVHGVVENALEASQFQTLWHEDMTMPHCRDTGEAF